MSISDMKKGITCAALFAVAIGISTQSQAAVLFSDNFDTDNTSSVLNFNSLNNWTVSGGTIDYIRSGDYGIDCVSGTGGCLDMDGSTSDAGRITSTATFTIFGGLSYTLAGQVSGNQRQGNPDTITWGVLDAITNATLISITTAPIAVNEPFTLATVSFSLGSAPTVRLFFEGDGGDNMGVILDNVVFSDNSTSVPEPATLAMILLGVAGVGATRRKKQA